MFYAVRNVAIGAATLALATGFSLPAKAAYTVTLLQQGPDVVATGSGSIDLTGLIFVGSSGGDEAIISGGLGIIVVGPVPFTASNEYGGLLRTNRVRNPRRSNCQQRQRRPRRH